MKFHRQTILTPIAASVALLLTAGALHSAEPAKAPPRVDPQALGHLQRMSASLAAAKAFSYKSTSTLEVPARTGQFLTLFSAADVVLKRPNKLWVRLAGEAPHFDFHYDGASVAACAPAAQVYSLTKAPPALDSMLPELERETGIRFASMPLLFSNPYSVLSRGVTSAMVVGSGRVRGEPCVHLAFKSPGVNWEIWIESGSRALPRRLATTFTDRANFPRTLVEFSDWNLHPWISDSKFVFRPPAGSREMPFRSVMKSTAR